LLPGGTAASQAGDSIPISRATDQKRCRRARPPKRERTRSLLNQIAQAFRIPFSILEFEIQILYQIPSDNRLCTRSEEWDAIRALATRDGPRIGMMLDLRDLGNMIALRESVLRGRIGSIQSVVLAGLHPLLYGTGGFAETSFTSPGVTIADDDADAPLILPPSASRPGGWLEDFLADVGGAPRPHGLDTDRVLAAMRWALDLQSHADHCLP